MFRFIFSLRVYSVEIIQLMCKQDDNGKKEQNLNPRHCHLERLLQSVALRSERNDRSMCGRAWPSCPKYERFGYDCVADARRPVCGGGTGGCVAVRAGQLEKDEGCAAGSGGSVFWCLWASRARRAVWSLMRHSIICIGVHQIGWRSMRATV